MKKGFVAVLASAVLVASGSVLAQEDEAGLEHLVIEMATTSAQHHAVAGHYSAKAEEARHEMRRHERMARAYSNARAAQPQMRTHCEALARKYGEIAAEYEELEKLHEQEALHAPQ